MATLTRPKTVEEPTDTLLRSTVPAPFPRNPVEQEQYLRENHLSPSINAKNAVQAKEVVGLGQDAATVQSRSSREEIKSAEFVQEITPSIANVQASCLIILNNLLSSWNPWQPIGPEREHSINHSGPSSPETQPTLTLHTLVSNLRRQDRQGFIPEVASSSDNTGLLIELEERVQKLADSSILIPSDAELARSLVSLLVHLDRFSVLRSTNPSCSFPSSSTIPRQTQAGSDIFDTLKHSLGELQIDRLSRSSSSSPQAGQSPALIVESALLWSRIDSDLEHVLSICRQRSETRDSAFPPDLEQLPPEYEYNGDFDYEILPQYDGLGPSMAQDLENAKSQGSTQQDYHHVALASISNEKMRLDLEAVTVAIDRLYLAAPQLHNQRVELKKSKVEEMEKARLFGKTGLTKGKQKQSDMRDLDEMLALIGKASERRLVNQSVVLEGGLEARLEKAKRRDVEKRQAFVEQLAKHSDAGRFHDQDAVLHPSRTRDPEALLTLPEFMREPVPTRTLQANPRTVLTLPEFIKEPLPENPKPLPTASSSVSMAGNLGRRSMSTSSLSWIFNSASKPPSPGAPEKRYHRKNRPATSNESLSVSSAGLDLHYIAEYHENLQHVVVFFNVTGDIAGDNLEAEIYSELDGGERLVLTCGSRTTSPVALPARLVPGKREVKVQSGHFELKLPTIPPISLESSEPAHTGLFDATALTKCSPTAFICSSCSLPLVQSKQVREYKDLPSEHWEELVDAWMCHSDQKLHEHVVKHANNGFWPMKGQALVGGSYIVFRKGSVVESNLVQVNGNRREDWRSVRCICGAAVGRCQKPPAEHREESMVYRLVKYAIRPVSPTVEPSRVPLSAFIVEDMQEYVHAHATYRFILHDEEEERPRILIWLFKPSMRIAYATPTTNILPRTGCIHAAKVLFKLLGPNVDLDSMVSKYPGFPQAEHLLYPLDICRRLAGLLKESNAAYPESMRLMTGLEVGFLQRA